LADPPTTRCSPTGRRSAPSTGRCWLLATERAVEQSGIGWTTLRATQFHDLILMVARALAKLPVIPAPTGSRFQPVNATEVAEQMAELALGEPSGLVPDLAGPKSTPWPSWSKPPQRGR
jgi:uncharacterized protein YbjT (DUF2867 family)